MTVVPGTSPEKHPAKFQSSCPFLGMQSDPQTHVGVPDPRNYCGLVDPPAAVKLSHQDKYCLRNTFQNCEVYIRSGELPRPADIFEQEEIGKRSITGPLMPLAWARRKDKKAAVAAAAEATQENVTLQTEEPSTDPYIESESRDTTWPREFRPLRSKTWLVIALGLSLLVILIAGWGAINRLQTSRVETEQRAQSAFTGGLATAVQAIGVAGNDWGTAIVKEGSPTWTPNVNLNTATETGLLTSPGNLLTATPTPVNVTTTPVGTPPICQDIPSIKFEISSGPVLDPQPGILLPVWKVPPVARAEWKVKNTGSCSWSQIYLMSPTNNQIISPIIKKGEQIINLNDLQGVPIAVPGEEIAIVLEFPVNKYYNFSRNDEWSLVVNGISLPEQPRFVINAPNWIRILIPPTTTPTIRAKGGRQTVSPPPRPTPT
jgi:hypothetical protein